MSGIQTQPEPKSLWYILLATRYILHLGFITHDKRWQERKRDLNMGFIASWENWKWKTETENWIVHPEVTKTEDAFKIPVKSGWFKMAEWEVVLEPCGLNCQPWELPLAAGFVWQAPSPLSLLSRFSQIPPRYLLLKTQRFTWPWHHIAFVCQVHRWTGTVTKLAARGTRIAAPAHDTSLRQVDRWTRTVIYKTCR